MIDVALAALQLDAQAGEEASSRPFPPTGLFKRLSSDCVLHVAKFLLLDEFLRVELLSQYARLLLGRESGISRVYWHGVFQQHVAQRMQTPPDATDEPDKSTCTHEVCAHPQPISCPQSSRVLLTQALRLLRSPLGSQPDALYSLLCGCSAASSVDRAEEGPNNVLFKSFCLDFLARTQTPLFQQFSTAQLGDHAQRNCGCAEHTPCYWSSQPSVQPNKSEFIAFAMAAPVSLVMGFSITPYQAFHHPEAPIYAPQEVVLQFLLPNVASPASPAAPYPLGATDVYSPQVYYQSPPFPVHQSFRQQFFLLPRAALCLYGSVRLVCRGMIQRQTLGVMAEMQQAAGGGEMPHATDFYICLSHVGVFGLPLPAAAHRSAAGVELRALEVQARKAPAGGAAAEAAEAAGAGGAGGGGGSEGQSGLSRLLARIFGSGGGSGGSATAASPFQLSGEEAVALRPAAARFCRDFFSS